MSTMSRDVVLALVRLLVAAIFLWHGIPKALDPAMAAEKFAGFGLPGWMGGVVGWIEVVAAPFLIVGFFHRVAAAVLIVVIASALVTVQIPGGVTAGLERDLLILVSLALLLTTDPGRLALGGRRSERRGPHPTS